MFKKRQTPERRVPRQPQTTNVFSYYSSRSNPDTSRGRYEPPATHRRGLERLKHVPSVIALVVVVFSLVYASLLDSKPRIVIAASSSGKQLQRPSQAYEAYIRKQLEASVLNKSKLTFKSESITKDMKKEFPEVSNAIVTVPLLGHRPIVHIAVSSPAFALATSQGAYYISADGVPLVRVSEVQNPLTNIPTVTDETNLTVTVGKQILPENTVQFVTDLIAQLKAAQTPIDTITFPLEASEVQVKLKDKPYYIRFNTMQNAKVQAGTYLAVQERLEGSGELPEEYIDVRVEERAYYK